MCVRVVPVSEYDTLCIASYGMFVVDCMDILACLVGTGVCVCLSVSVSVCVCVHMHSHTKTH